MKAIAILAFLVSCAVPTSEPAPDGAGVVTQATTSTFHDVTRVHDALDCSTDDQRDSIAFFDNTSYCATGTHSLTDVALQCSAYGGTYNMCLEALYGDIQLDNGDITVTHGGVTSGGSVWAFGTLYAAGEEGLELYHGGSFVSVRMTFAPPTDVALPGSIVVDKSGPALWINMDGGTGWRKFALVQ